MDVVWQMNETAFCWSLAFVGGGPVHLAWDLHQQAPILYRQPRGIRQDASMCRICAIATRQHYVQALGFYMGLSGIRQLLSHGLQTMHSRPSHGPLACHLQFVCTANALQAKELICTDLKPEYSER